MSTATSAGVLAAAAVGLLAAAARAGSRRSHMLAGWPGANSTDPRSLTSRAGRLRRGPDVSMAWPAGRKAGRRRQVAVDREVPQLLDLLAAGSGAGLSAEIALRRAALALRGPLGTDLRDIFGRADVGARWRDELAGYCAGAGSKDLRRSVAVLERTERLGSSLEEATRELAGSVRQARRAAVLGRARTAPVKMLFPLVFLILPAFLLLTVVPVLLTTIRSIG